MASRIGTVREVLCRGLHSLEKDRLIIVKRGRLVVKDIDRLREIAVCEREDNLFPITLPMKVL
jgi:hypothetical protein